MVASRCFISLTQGGELDSMSLGGDAPHVEANPAQIGGLDAGDVHPELGSANGGHVAARAAADDDDIKGGVGHAIS